MNDLLQKAISAAQASEMGLTKYITANDTGATGAHQSGYHIPKNAWQLFFDKPGIKGVNNDHHITIKWQDDFETNSRIIYYGVGTRNEYRLTRFGKGFPFLQDENIGDLLVITKKANDYYEAFVLHTDEDIDEFMVALNIAATDINGIIPKQFQLTGEAQLLQCFEAFIAGLKTDFPPTEVLAANARNCYNGAWSITSKNIQANPDKELLGWIAAEFQLFKALENNRYADRIKKPFTSVEQLVETANTILNRRKSRAGKSLEHHLAEVFRTFGLVFETQSITEDNKKPDFLFPGVGAYLNPVFNSKKLIMLAAKTTCKDRWRQVLNEADRIKTKHLFTLQQGISQNQLEEMYKYGVRLVVPKPYLTSFPQIFREQILTLDSFLAHVVLTQGL